MRSDNTGTFLPEAFGEEDRIFQEFTFDSKREWKEERKEKSLRTPEKKCIQKKTERD